MTRLQQISERPGWLQDLNSMLLSALCHLAVLVALGLLTIASKDSWRGVKLMADVGDTDTAAAFDESPLEMAVELESTPEPAAAMGPVHLFEEIAVPTTDFAALASFSANAAEASGFEGLALGGNGEKEGTGGRASTDFFGIGGYGQSFVYVVDCSGSMSENGKFDRARYELLHSIEQLGSDQQYFVIFFNHGAYPMEGEKMVAATQEQIGRTTEWVNNAVADGGTYPLPALLHALSLKPDAIYFLSDGQFDPATIQVMRQRNRLGRRDGKRQIPIHTIAFMDRATEFLMRTIARNSGGEYRFVQ